MNLNDPANLTEAYDDGIDPFSFDHPDMVGVLNAMADALHDMEAEPMYPYN